MKKPVPKKPFLAALSLIMLTGAAVDTPPEHRRPPDQTFLTVPEWFLVFSPEEYADWLRAGDPSRFPFFGHVGQFWQSYRDVTSATADYPANPGYHVMVSVIGVSTTAEYGLKGFYERTIGRFTELAAGRANTAEDRLAARVAQDYVDFIKRKPWYEFDFLTPARKVWTDTGLTGADPLRKWERKYLLTSEYLVKAGYAWLIGKATRASYERPIEATYVEATTGAGPLPPGVDLMARDGQTSLLRAPRYQAFTDAALALAQGGSEFQAIAGNRGDILVTYLAHDPAAADQRGGRLLYVQPILTRPGTWRLAVVYSMAELGHGLRRATKAGDRIEHVYDF